MTIIALSAILNRLGGSKNKNYRRWGLGVLFFLLAIMKGLPIGVCALCLPASHILRLPISRTDDDINTKGDFAWVYVVSLLWTITILPFYIGDLESYLSSALVFSLVVGSSICLSNIKQTADIFKWEFVECLYGALLGYLAVSA